MWPSPTVTFCKGQAARRNHFICPLESQKLDKKRCVTAEEIKRRMNMNDKFCTYCGTPLEENAKFCVGCGSKTDAAPVYAGADAPAPGAPQQTGVYYQMQQEPAPPQAGGYYQQPTAAPVLAAVYYPPQQPGAGYPNLRGIRADAPKGEQGRPDRRHYRPGRAGRRRRYFLCFLKAPGREARRQ